MTDINIPPEAVEAAAWYLWKNGYTPHRDISENVARAAILAALDAWPGMHTHEWQRPWLGGMSGTDIILPLNTENADG